LNSDGTCNYFTGALENVVMSENWKISNATFDGHFSEIKT